ncbi:hypothetical protein, partial [Xanthovirga aplysinae]|uniref:hypothetical protein n=1 Tax=Xanthovirga aplysinae TaxID=2529853 RepID=UPI001CA461FA
AEIIQNGAMGPSRSNKALILQTGDNHEASIIQTNARNNRAAIFILGGSGNSATINQSGMRNRSLIKIIN